MTTRPRKTARPWFSNVPTLFLSASAVMVALSADSATTAGPSHPSNFSSWTPGQIVFPRAGVSSDAYRTRSHLLAQTSRSRQNRTPNAPVEPARLVQAAAARSTRSDSVVPVDHQTVQPFAARGENRPSVRAELERLYAEEGREMPQMVVPQHQPPQQFQPQLSAGAGPAIAPNLNPPSELTYRKKTSAGLLAGLFDFGRKNRSRSSSAGMPMRPPAEPRPFQPPTYRQQLQPVAAPQAKQTPMSQSPAAQRQATVQSQQSADVFTLQKRAQAASPRNFDEPKEGFFPGDSSALPVVEAQLQPAVTGQQPVTEDHESFFPNDAPTQPSGDSPTNIAADSMKARMNKLLRTQPREMADDGSQVTGTKEGFSAPVTASDEESIDPPAAPGAVSEIVTTTVAPFVPKTNPREPAPFFSEGERTIDPQEDMDIAALNGQTFEPSGADAEESSGTVTSSMGAGSRMQQIAAREGVGLKGFCPVALRDQRSLQDGRAAYVSFFRSQAYYFSSMRAKETFDANPQQYAPAAGGQDVTLRTLTGEIIEGSLDHCVWYKDRLYLFQSAENLATFMAAPSAMAVVD